MCHGTTSAAAATAATVMVLVGNKTDLAAQQEVSEEDARAFADRWVANKPKSCQQLGCYNRHQVLQQHAYRHVC